MNQHLSDAVPTKTDKLHKGIHCSDTESDCIIIHGKLLLMFCPTPECILHESAQKSHNFQLFSFYYELM